MYFSDNVKILKMTFFVLYSTVLHAIRRVMHSCLGKTYAYFHVKKTEERRGRVQVHVICKGVLQCKRILLYCIPYTISVHVRYIEKKKERERGVVKEKKEEGRSLISSPPFVCIQVGQALLLACKSREEEKLVPVPWFVYACMLCVP